MTHPHARHAFTLIELSVVLVIIALIVGGVVTGQQLIRQAELNGIITDLGKFKGAYLQFRDTYGGKPGDLVDAVDYWGTDPNGCPTNSVHTPRVETCNGDGNNVIAAPESFRVWQHLSGAGLVEGTYSGVQAGGGANHAVAGQNVPRGKLSNSAFYLDTFPALTGNANYFETTRAADTVYFGLHVASSWPAGPILTPRQQLQLDTKIDDSKPAVGAMFALRSPLNPGCTTSDLVSATYLATNANVACSIIYFIE